MRYYSSGSASVRKNMTHGSGDKFASDGIFLVRLEHAETSDGRNITLKFSERLSQNNISNVQNYILNPSQPVYSAWLDEKDPTIVHLIVSLSHSGSYDICVSGLSSTSGGGMDGEHNSATFVCLSTLSIQLNKALTNDNKLVTLTFSEALRSAEANDRNNYVFQPGAAVISAQLDANHPTVVNLITSLDPDTLYAVRAENLVSASGQDGMDPQVSSRVVSRFLLPLVQLNKAQTNDNQLVTLTFSETLRSAEANDRNNYVFQPGAAVISAQLDANHPTVVNLITSLDPDILYAVKAENLVSASGRNGMDPQVSSRVVTRFLFPLIQLNKAQTNDNQLVTLTFSEALRSAEANNRNNYVFQPGATVISAQLDANNPTVVNLITSLDPGTLYAVKAENLVSASGQDGMDPQVSSRVVHRHVGEQIQRDR